MKLRDPTRFSSVLSCEDLLISYFIYDQDFVDSQASRAPSELIRALFICDAIT